MDAHNSTQTINKKSKKVCKSTHKQSINLLSERKINNKIKLTQKSDSCDMSIQDFRDIFEILDVKQLGYIGKNNFGFTRLSLVYMDRLKPFITEMLTRDGVLYLDEYLKIIGSIMQTQVVASG